MAIPTGKGARVKIGSTLFGHLVGSVNYEVTETAVDITAAEDTNRKYKALGLKDGGGDFQALFDTADTGQDAVRTAMAAAGSAEVTIEIYPEGVTAGLPKFSGTAVITSFKQVEADVEGAIKVSVSFKGFLTEGVAS